MLWSPRIIKGAVYHSSEATAAPIIHIYIFCELTVWHYLFGSFYFFLSGLNSKATLYGRFYLKRIWFYEPTHINHIFLCSFTSLFLVGVERLVCSPMPSVLYLKRGYLGWRTRAFSFIYIWMRVITVSAFPYTFVSANNNCYGIQCCELLYLTFESSSPFLIGVHYPFFFNNFFRRRGFS